MVMLSHNICIEIICSYHRSGFIDELGALLTFNPAPKGKTIILARVGVSLISSEQACANAEEEIPGFNFDEIHRNARTQWNDLLSRVQVDTAGVPKETVELFYSSVRIISHMYNDQYFDMQVALSHPHISCRLWVSPSIVLTLIDSSQIQAKIQSGTLQSHTLTRSIVMYAVLSVKVHDAEENSGIHIVVFIRLCRFTILLPSLGLSGR